MRETVTTTRAVRAECVPDGRVAELPAGTQVQITQALGGSFTLWVHGQLMRLRGADADAIGKPVPKAPTAAAGGGIEAVREQVWQVLRTCYDPEIPVNIVDLGLVYDMRILPLASGRSRVEVKMTLTAQGCGMGGPISMDAKHRLESLPGVDEADVQVVWDPPWNPHMISPEGRAKLGME